MVVAPMRQIVRKYPFATQLMKGCPGDEAGIWRDGSQLEALYRRG